MTIEISHYRTGETGTPGSIDADVTIYGDDGAILSDGELTILRDGHSGRWSSWGSPEHWCSLSASAETLREIVAAIDQSAADAVCS